MTPSRPTSSVRAMAADVAGARSRRKAPVLAAMAVLAIFVRVAPARAASLQKVNTSEWSVAGLPSYVSMYIYVPDQLAARPPTVVGPHHCQGTGPGTFNEMSSLMSIANRVGFIMIFPEATGQNPAAEKPAGCNCVLGSPARHGRTGTVAILVLALTFVLRPRRFTADVA
jgi:poly(3-hydroxybutyrate) depolymerase